MFCMILCGFPLIFCLFCSVSEGKSCFSIRKPISTSVQCAEHPFAGRNTQHSTEEWSDGFSTLETYLYMIGSKTPHLNQYLVTDQHKD